MKFYCLSVSRLPKILLLILFVITYCNSYGQDVKSKIDQNDLRKFINTLSSIEFEGRAVDNSGQIKTQELIIDRFKTLEVEPYSSDGYLEKFTLNLTDKGGVYLKTQNGQNLQNLDRIAFTGAIPPIKVIESQIVYGGYGTDEELNAISVENRLVLILSESRSGDYEIKKRLEERGAIGLIYFHKDDMTFKSTKNLLNDFSMRKRFSIANNQDAMTPDPQQLNLKKSDEEVPQPIEIPFLYSIIIPGTEVKNVMGLPKNRLINLAKRKKIKNVPAVDISVHFEQAKKTIETANVMGIIRGESEQSIILSAHYDHVGMEKNRYFPGADDNASGVAALLELAEEFKQYEHLKYTMIFLATSAEECGLLGSSYHVNHPDFDPKAVFCDINIDMIARCDSKKADCNYLYCIYENQYEMLDSLIKETDMHFPNCMCDYSENNSGIMARSDAYSFSKKGIPSIFFFTGFHDDYHKPTDTIDKIDFTILENRILLISEFIKQIQITPEK